MIPCAIDARGFGKVNFVKPYAAVGTSLGAALAEAFRSGDDEALEIQFVLFALDAPFPSGGPDDESGELGMGGLSLKELHSAGVDQPVGPTALVNSEGASIGTLSVSVNALAALRTLAGGT